MNICCIDKTENKLFLIPEVLSFLNYSGNKVSFDVPSRIKTKYGAFFDLYPNLIINPSETKTESDVSVVFVDSVQTSNSGQNANAIIYPIIKSRDDAKLLIERQGKSINHVVPFDKRVMNNHHIGELESFKDLIEMKIREQDLSDKSIVVSAGPTIEDIDPVRFMSNRSSGKMGIALARTAKIRGANVELLLGPTHQSVPVYLNPVPIRSATDFFEAVDQRYDSCDYYIGAAAIADFTPAKISAQKIKKQNGILKIDLQPTTDILKSLGERKQHQKLIGFSVETENTVENSRQKMARKNLDMIVINNPNDAGAAFGQDTNLVTIMYKNGQTESMPLMSKLDLSHLILDRMRRLV